MHGTDDEYDVHKLSMCDGQKTSTYPVEENDLLHAVKAPDTDDEKPIIFKDGVTGMKFTSNWKTFFQVKEQWTDIFRPEYEYFNWTNHVMWEKLLNMFGFSGDEIPIIARNYGYNCEQLYDWNDGLKMDVNILYEGVQDKETMAVKYILFYPDLDPIPYPDKYHSEDDTILSYYKNV